MKILNYIITAFVALLISVSAQAQQYSKITYVHSDPDGTAFAATDEQGNVEWKIEHFPFGREFENTSQDRKSDISFAGKPYDEEIGLSYFGGRWYDPDAGRFTGIDPMPVQANDYETFNRYSYAFNNPYKYVDPDGNFAFLIPIAIFLAKEIAAEAASRATGGATDFLSVRRSGTKLIKGGISLLNKQKKNSLSTMDTSASKGGGGTDFVVGSNGTTAATSQSRMRKGFDDAGFPSKDVVSPTSGNVVGQSHTLPDGNKVRTMVADGRNERRASFTTGNGSPMNGFTGKQPQPPRGMSKGQRMGHIRKESHLKQGK